MKDDKRCAKGRRHFEYHCLESEDSGDAELWHHTHQPVEVIRKLKVPTEVDYGEPAMYHVKFSDGYSYDVFEDELLKHPKEYTRPDYVSKTKKGKWATDFMEGYRQMGPVNAIDKRDRLIDGVSVNLSDYVENDKVIKVWTIMSRVRGQGSGSKVLEKLKALADETKTSIVLKPGPWGLAPVLTVPQLKEWYMRHGFKEIKHGWLIYTPKGVTVKVDLNKRLGEGFWNRKAKRSKRLNTKVGRCK